MTKLTKLKNDPVLFFVDAAKNKTPSILKPTVEKILSHVHREDKKNKNEHLEKIKNIILSEEDPEKGLKFLNYISFQEGFVVTKNLYLYLAENEIKKLNYDLLLRIIEILNENEYRAEALYCKALLLYYKKEINEAFNVLVELFFKIGYQNKSAIYLLSECCQYKDDKEFNLKLLNSPYMLKQSKTWLIFANMVDNKNEFYNLIFLYRNAIKNKWVKKDNIKVVEYIALASLRVKDYELAKEIWRELLLNIYSKRNYNLPKINYNKNYHSNKAEDALLDLNDLFNAYNLKFFLISGTLLGAIRENKLLGHDNDIDVGVFENITPQTIYNLIKKSDRFFELKSRSEKIIRLKHINGINIDIFYHYEEDAVYWHSGVKVKWKNTLFNLKDYNFLGQTFKIPDQPELYLIENYGEGWVEPQVDFDSTFDTPNGYVIDNAEAIIYCYKMLIKYKDYEEKLWYYLDKLELLDDCDFVDKIKKLKNTRL